MIRKIDIIVFIFLTLFLISSVSAAEIENETITTQSTPQESVHIETHDVDMYYKDGTRFAANSYDENENPLSDTQTTFSLNGVNYTRQTNENGRASLAINLNSGKYDITTTVKENSVHNTINIRSTIESDDVVKIFKNSTQYYAKFLDKNGDALKNTPVTFNINGVFYTRTTDENGTAKLNLNLHQGKYILTATNPINNEQKSNNITILSQIINNNDVVKYYRNATKYSVTILEKNGSTVGLGHEVEFNINGVFYYRHTNIHGVASLNLNLGPGDYIITAQYEGCYVSNKIKILPTLTGYDILMEYQDGTKFKVYLVDGIGNPAAFERVNFNINGVFYTRTTNENGIASLNINLQPGEYIITSEHNELRIANMIKIHPKIIGEKIKSTDFTYEIKVPNYVNVTFPFVYPNSFYSINEGINGIIRMEKNQLIEIQIGYKYFTYSTANMPEYGATYLGSEYVLLPFDGITIEHSYNLEDLTGNGIILYRSKDYTHFIYKNNCSSNIEQFGAYIDKGLDKSEIINYVQNGETIAKIKFQTINFDELGLKLTLSQYYGKSIYDFDYKTYKELIGNEVENIKFVNTGEPVTFNYFGTKIAGYLSEEDIIAKFNSANCIEFEKSELITYGLSDKYKGDFDVLHSFAIINDRVSDKTMNEWITRENEYKTDVKMQSLYTMFLTSLNTAYLSDKVCDNLTSNTDLKWSRTNNTVILGAMNWKDTYQHILTPDMGRQIMGNNESEIIKFRFVNSILLSKIEQFSLKPIAEDADVNITSVFDDVFNSLKDYRTSIVYYNNTAILSDESGNSSFMIDLKSGLVTPLSVKDGFAYKGVTITRDCGLCSIYSMSKEVLKNVNNGIGTINDLLNYIGDNIQPLTSLTVKGVLLGKGVIGALIGGSLTIGLSLFGTALGIQGIGVYYVDNHVDSKDLHTAYDHITFTRPGYMQNTKIYNIPKDDGSVDYLEIPLKKDNSYDRDNVKYISKGNVKTLTKEETYNYFAEDSWSPFNVPQKYWR
ncbi:adhesin [Methanobrevibacter sp.]|uniref:adhesin n=1 Tax=Methanobrevibacter sp. TaxID=66852 RepID=UPI00388F9C2F